MCDISAISTVASLGSAYSGYQAANAQAAAYNKQAAIADQNAKLEISQITDVENQKQEQLAAINEKKKQVIGAQRAAMAANGTDSSMGSGLSDLTDTAYRAKQDADNTEYNAAKQDWGYKVEAQNYSNQAANYRSQASAASSAATGALFGGLLSATGQNLAKQSPVASKWQSSAFPKFDKNLVYNNQLYTLKR